MTPCEYCGRSDHGETTCWQKHDHVTMKVDFIDPSHCISCNKQDIEKGRLYKEKFEKKEEPKVCSNKFTRHQWVSTDKQIVVNETTGQHFAHYMFICPDCDEHKVTTLAA